MLETISLVAVSVFGHPLGPFYQSLVLDACLACIIILLCLSRPYRKQQANTLAVLGVTCLLFTAFVAQSFLPYGDIRPGTAYDIGAATALLFVNVSFIGFLVYKLFRVVDWPSATDRLAQYCKSCSKASKANMPGAPAHSPGGRQHEIAPSGASAGRWWPKETRGMFGTPGGSFGSGGTGSSMISTGVDVRRPTPTSPASSAFMGCGVVGNTTMSSTLTGSTSMSSAAGNLTMSSTMTGSTTMSSVIGGSSVMTSTVVGCTVAGASSSQQGPSTAASSLSFLTRSLA